MSDLSDPRSLLGRESITLGQRLRTWTPARYAAAAGSGTRADVVHHLAQALADLAADAERSVRRPLPRLDSDLGLPDQLAVTAEDLVRAAPSRQVARDAVAHLLAHRADLLGDEVPPGLAAALGLPDPVAAGRTVCAASRR